MILKLLKEKMQTCGKSRYQICNETAVDKAILHRIIHGGTCKVETAERLLEYFGLIVVESDQGKR
jgi:hypothetical protein